MDLLKALRFVRGAVSTNDIVPEMKHFIIQDGNVRSYNGVLALSSPLDFAVDCKPKASSFVTAIGHCDDVLAMSMTDSGRLRLQSGAFKVFIECIEEDQYHPVPAGDMIEIDGAGLLDAFKKVSPFVGNDASRPWTNGVLLRGHAALATNNVCLVEYWLASAVPHVVNIPMLAVKEVVRINEAPLSAQLDNNSISFHFEGGRWLKTQLYETEWPDLSRIFEVPSAPIPVNPELFVGLDVLKGFSDRDAMVFFRDGAIHTAREKGTGASYMVEGLHREGVYRIPMLRLLKEVATHVDFTPYPNPTLFFGDRLRGAIIGMGS